MRKHPSIAIPELCVQTRDANDGPILGNFKANAQNSCALSGLQAKNALKSRKLEGGKAAAENSIWQSQMEAIYASSFQNSQLPITELGCPGLAHASTGPRAARGLREGSQNKAGMPFRFKDQSRVSPLSSLVARGGKAEASPWQRGAEAPGEQISMRRPGGSLGWPPGSAFGREPGNFRPSVLAMLFII
jgi:hypothetical protein